MASDKLVLVLVLVLCCCQLPGIQEQKEERARKIIVDLEDLVVVLFELEKTQLVFL